VGLMRCPRDGREPVTASSAWREFTGKVGPLRQDWQDVEVFNIKETSVQRGCAVKVIPRAHPASEPRVAQKALVEFAITGC
jgi:hypothetical protein